MITTLGPVELKVLIKPESPIEQHRLLFCERYDACLDEAVAKAWTSWTCGRCALFERAAALAARGLH